jgi:hypothetical protein
MSLGILTEQAPAHTGASALPSQYRLHLSLPKAPALLLPEGARALIIAPQVSEQQPKPPWLLSLCANPGPSHATSSTETASADVDIPTLSLTSWVSC